MTSMPPNPQPYAMTHDYAPQAESQTNGLGLAGFILSLVGLIATCGLLCPIGLLLSVIGLFKQPRGFAIAGTIIGGLGTVALIAFAVALGYGVIWGMNQAQNMQGQLHNQMAMQNASTDIDQYYAQHRLLPDDAAGNQLLSQSIMNDSWNQPLHYRKLASDRFELISMGPDGQLNTTDDLKLEFQMDSSGMSHSVGDLFMQSWNLTPPTTMPTAPTQPLPVQP